MPLTSGCVFQVLVGGKDTNGGFFDPEYGGTDRSQSPFPYVSFGPTLDVGPRYPPLAPALSGAAGGAGSIAAGTYYVGYTYVGDGSAETLVGDLLVVTVDAFTRLFLYAPSGDASTTSYNVYVGTAANALHQKLTSRTDFGQSFFWDGPFNTLGNDPPTVNNFTSKISTSGYVFQPEDTGNSVYIHPKTDLDANVLHYEIIAVSGGIAFLDRRAGSSNSTRTASGVAACSGFMGGGYGDLFYCLDTTFGRVVAGNRIWVSGGVYQVTRAANTSLDKDGHPNAPIVLEGYGVTRGDGLLPTYQAAFAANLAGNMIGARGESWVIRNLIVDGNSTGNTGVVFGSKGGLIENVVVTRMKGMGISINGDAARIRRCAATFCGSGIGNVQDSCGFKMSSGISNDRLSYAERCVALNNYRCGFVNESGTFHFAHCYALKTHALSGGLLDGYGFYHRGSGHTLLYSCSFYGNQRDGLILAPGTSNAEIDNFRCMNSVFESNGGAGIRGYQNLSGLGLLTPFFADVIINCAFSRNASGALLDIVSGGVSTDQINYTGSAFADPANDNFTLAQTGAGLTLRKAGIPTSWLLLTGTSGAPDVGASWDVGVPLTHSYNLRLDMVPDGDGIPPLSSPSGSPAWWVTYDGTPSWDWDDPDASGPYLFVWSVETSGKTTTLYTGSVAGASEMELPFLSGGYYWLTLTGYDKDGNAVAWPDTFFEVRELVPPEAEPPDTLPEGDVEKEVPDDESFLRYLPRWLAAFGTATAPASASTTFQFFVPTLNGLRDLSRQVRDLVDEGSLLTAPLGLPRLAWHLQSQYRPFEHVTVQVRASGSVVTDLFRAGSLHEFLTTDDPVFILGGDGQMLFRNLAQRTIVVQPLAASGQLFRRYQFGPEKGIIPDATVRFRQGTESGATSGIWYKMKVGSAGILPRRALVQLPEPYGKQPLTWKYQSRSYLPTLEVSVSGAPWTSPSRFDLWNRFDELGLLGSLERRRDEDNLAFKARVHSRYLTGLGATRDRVSQHVAQDLALTDVLAWDGRTTLSLALSGYYGAQHVEVLGLPELGAANEELLLLAPGSYHASKTEWLPASFLAVDGTPASPLRYPGLSRTEHVVSFGAPVTGTVQASYRYRNYTLARSAQGYVDTLTPVSGNVASGSYQVVLTRYVRSWTVNDPAFITARLLNANGTPNGLFYELRQRILEGSPVHFGRARWGERQYWFEADSDQPPTAHLPAVFDQITE